MQRKYLTLTAIGAIILALVAFGLSACYSREETPLSIFAFASDRTGAGDIFVLDKTGQIRNLTNHPEADWQPAWSPDGKTLAFTSHRTGNSDIWLLDIVAPGQTQVPRNLTNDPAWDYSPAWSPSRSRSTT